jgi:hypothetical protein
MPSIRFLALLPNKDSLYIILKKIKATNTAFITILRKQSQHKPLRNIILRLWFTILYQAVKHYTGRNKAVHKDSRCYVICNLTACLYTRKEIPGYNNNISKIISKCIRLRLAL